MIGYDFVGPRVEFEGIYRNNARTSAFPGTALNNQVGQLGIMANLMYDFMPASVITPYIGAGAGLALVDSNSSLGSTQFAYQGILGWARTSTRTSASTSMAATTARRTRRSTAPSGPTTTSA